MSAIQDPSIVSSGAEKLPARLPAGEALTIYTVEAFGATCQAELRRHPVLVIDLEKVAQCDTLGVQVLCAAMRSATALGRTLRLANAPAAVTRAAATIACERILFPEGHS